VSVKYPVAQWYNNCVLPTPSNPTIKHCISLSVSLTIQVEQQLCEHPISLDFTHPIANSPRHHDERRRGKRSKRGDWRPCRGPRYFIRLSSRGAGNPARERYVTQGFGASRASLRRGLDSSDPGHNFNPISAPFSTQFHPISTPFSTHSTTISASVLSNPSRVCLCFIAF